MVIRDPHIKEDLLQLLLQMYFSVNAGHISAFKRLALKIEA